MLLYQKRNQKIRLPIVGKTFFIWNGKKYVKLFVHFNIVNHCFGSFVFTRKRGKDAK